jgi:glycosyltransferase involved in cell wall biosynthesis
MTAKPLISIGMPAYNGEQYIRKALDSLLAQDYGNFELIISDNASTDATLQICREYAEKDQRIRVCVQSRNIGPIANFRAVSEMAQGK